MNILSILLKLTKWLIEYWATKNDELSDELQKALAEREDIVNRRRDLQKQIDYLEEDARRLGSYLINLELDLQKTRSDITQIQTERIKTIKERNELIREQTDDEVLRSEI